jgi:hypothetical protein
VDSDSCGGRRQNGGGCVPGLSVGISKALSHRVSKPLPKWVVRVIVIVIVIVVAIRVMILNRLLLALLRVLLVVPLTMAKPNVEERSNDDEGRTASVVIVVGSRRLTTESCADQLCDERGDQSTSK